MNYLENKVCFITGASSGIGKATALALLEQGARVFDFSRTKQLADEHPHDNLRSFRGDVSQEADVKAGFAACLEAFGTVDVLLNNAGLGLPTPDLSTADLDTFDRMVDTNLRGVFLCDREALAVMKPRGHRPYRDRYIDGRAAHESRFAGVLRVEIWGEGPQQWLSRPDA